jgi:hypothetical protein
MAQAWRKYRVAYGGSGIGVIKRKKESGVLQNAGSSKVSRLFYLENEISIEA